MKPLTKPLWPMLLGAVGLDAQAFCGDWPMGVSPGFDADSWMAKWPVLLGILLLVMLSTWWVIKRRAQPKSAQAQE